MEPFRGYPNLLSGESDTEPDMRDEETSEASSMETIMRELQQMKLETTALKRALKNVQQKEDNRAFAKTWEITAELETHDPHDSCSYAGETQETG